jgi:hypothetical protein
VIKQYIYPYSFSLYFIPNFFHPILKISNQTLNEHDAVNVNRMTYLPRTQKRASIPSREENRFSWNNNSINFHSRRQAENLKIFLVANDFSKPFLEILNYKFKKKTFLMNKTRVHGRVVHGKNFELIKYLETFR